MSNTPFVYVLAHPGYRSVKIGLSTEKSERLAALRSLGWQHRRSLHVHSRDLAYRIEQATLFHIRYALHAPVHIAADFMPCGGWTETVSASFVSAEAAWDLVCTEAAVIWLASDQPHHKVANRPPRETYRKPLADADLATVRALADDIGPEALSTKKIRTAVGCATEYAARLRDTVRAERGL